MHGMDAMFGGRMFPGNPMMALTDGQDGHHHRHQRHRDELDVPRHPGHSDMMAHSGQHDPFSFMSSMMSNMHNMMGNAFRQMVCIVCM